MIDKESKILDLWRNKYLPLREIGDKLEVGQRKIKAVLDKNGITNRKRPNVRKTLDHSKEIASKYRSGVPLTSLTDKYNASNKTIKEALRQEGIDNTRGISEAKHAKNAREVDLTFNKNLAYLVGVLVGDGSVYKAKRGNSTTHCMALHVKDKVFAKSFKKSLEQIGLSPTFCQKGCSREDNNRMYWYVLGVNRKAYNWFQNFDLETILDKTAKEKQGFIKGFYESEGGFYTNQNGGDELMVGCGKERELIELVDKIIHQLEFNTNLFSSSVNQKASFGQAITIHFLRLLGGRDSQERFFKLINPCIKNGLSAL